MEDSQMTSKDDGAAKPDGTAKRMWRSVAARLRLWFVGSPETNSLEGLDSPGAQQALTALMVTDLLKERRTERNWRLIRRSFYTVASVMLLAYYAYLYLGLSGKQIDLKDGPVIGVVRIEGTIMHTSLASGDKIVPALKRAFEDDRVKLVVLAIDSGGGAPVEAERIGFMIDALRKKHKKPVYAVIQNLGASAAYMIAMNTDKIYAGRYSLVGSIGAVMSSWDLHRAIKKLDVEQKVFASGELKAMLNPFVAPTVGAERKAQELVNKAGALFNAQLQERRKDKLVAGVNYGSGEIWDGDQAVKIGLVDELGTLEKIALDHDAVIREYGPSQRTYSPFAAQISEVAHTLGASMMRGAMQTAADANTSGLR